MLKGLSLKRIFGGLLILGGLGQQAEAARFDTLPASPYLSARAAAMGNSFLAVADDVPSALFYNPAALANVQTMVSEPMHFQNKGTWDTYSGAGLESYRALSLGSYQSRLEQRSPELHGSGFGMAPNFGYHGLGAAVLGQFETGARQVGQEIESRSMYQLIPAVGYGLRLAKGLLRIGYSLQYVNQASGQGVWDANASDLSYTQGLHQGAGFSHNLGATLTLPYRFLPSFNLVARNIMDLDFGPARLLRVAGNSPGQPEARPMTFDAGFGMQPRFGYGRHAMTLLFEKKDILGASGVSLLRRLSVGAEVALNHFLFLRGGWGAGYPSAGIGIRRNLSDLSISWFSEELGDGFRDSRDVKMMLQYQVRAF